MSRPKGSDLNTFLTHVCIGKSDECWLWQGARSGEYGGGWYNGKKEGAHRVSYMLFVGEIPEGLDVLHSCDTPLCVNPKHLSAGTHQKNIQESFDKGRRKILRGEQIGVSKLTADKVIQIWKLRNSGLTRRQIAEQFGVSSVTVTHIASGKTWRHVTKQLEETI